METLMKDVMLRCCALFLLVALAACSRGPLNVTSVQLGRSVNPDGSVNAHTTGFKPNDTVYLAVITEGLGSGTVGVKWSYGAQQLSEESKSVSYNDHAATSFKLQSGNGFFPGAYKVDVLVDGKTIDTRDFRVDN
jgi:hypothetical protein